MTTMDCRRVLQRMLVVAAIALSASQGLCGTLTGTISSILYHNAIPGIAFVTLNGTTSGPPGCAAVYTAMALDLTTVTGKAIHTNLLLSRLTNPAASVTLNGTNGCATYTGYESVSHVWF